MVLLDLWGGAEGWRYYFACILRNLLFLSCPGGTPSPEEASEQGHSGLHLMPMHMELSPTTTCLITCGPLWTHRPHPDPTEMAAVLCSVTAQQQTTPSWLLSWGSGVLMNINSDETEPKTSGDTTLSYFYRHLVLSGLAGYVFEIPVSPCYPCTASGADSSGAVVWAVGSNKSPWWLCPSLKILCNSWESGSAWPGSGSEMWDMLPGSGLDFKSWLSDQSKAAVFLASPIPSQPSHDENMSQNMNWVHRIPATRLWWEHVHAWRNYWKH